MTATDYLLLTMGLSTTVTVVVRTIEASLRQRFGLPLRPYKLLLELTSNCNSKCATCSIWKNPASKTREDLTLAQIELVFEEMGRDLVWLALSGGEVTLRKDFREIVNAARKHCPNLKLVTFTTNGLKPDIALAYALAVKELGVECFITVSLDGDEATHDRLRGVPGNYRLAQRTCQLLREHGIRTHYGLTVSSDNESFIHDSFQVMRRDIKAVTFVHSGGIYGQDNAETDQAILRSMTKVHKDYEVSTGDEFLERLYIKLGVRFLRRGRGQNVVPCSVGHTSLHVHPDGTVGNCMFLPSIGNVKETPSLRSLVNGNVSRTQLDAIAQDQCPHCWMNCYAPHSMLMHPLRAIVASSDRLTAIGEYLAHRITQPRRSNTEEGRSTIAATVNETAESRDAGVALDATPHANSAAATIRNGESSTSPRRLAPNDISHGKVIRLPVLESSGGGASRILAATSKCNEAENLNTAVLL